MADAVTSDTLHDGPRNAVMSFSNTSDATGEDDVTKVDVSSLSAHPHNGACTGVRVDKIRYNTTGMGVKILWDATGGNSIVKEIPADSEGTIDYCAIGGLQNDNPNAGVTGDINFTTVSATTGDTYRITLDMVKQYGS